MSSRRAPLAPLPASHASDATIIAMSTITVTDGMRALASKCLLMVKEQMRAEGVDDVCEYVRLLDEIVVLEAERQDDERKEDLKQIEDLLKRLDGDQLKQLKQLDAQRLADLLKQDNVPVAPVVSGGGGDAPVAVTAVTASTGSKRIFKSQSASTRRKWDENKDPNSPSDAKGKKRVPQSPPAGSDSEEEDQEKRMSRGLLQEPPATKQQKQLIKKPAAEAPAGKKPAAKKGKIMTEKMYDDWDFS